MKHTYPIEVLRVFWAGRFVYLAVLYGTLFAVTSISQATDWRSPGAQKESICQGSCGGGCGPCPTEPSRPTYTPPSRDYEAARRAQEAEAAAAAERQRQQAEAERIKQERIAEEKRKKDAEFIRARDATVLKGSSGLSTPHLKGIAGSELKGSGDNLHGLKDAVRDTGLKGSTQNNEVPAKQVAAWKQVHCAASIAQYALAALQTKGDYDEFGTLSVEAFKAMDGQRPSVECGVAPAFPSMNGKTVNMDRVIASERQILERATVIAERMKQRGDKPSAAQQPKPPANETPIEKARREQRELNVINTTKNTGKTPQETKQKEEDRKELANLVLKNNELESGKLVNRSHRGLDEVDVPSPTSKQ